MYINKERLTVAITMAILIAVVIAAGAWWDPADARGAHQSDNIAMKGMFYFVNAITAAAIGAIVFIIGAMIFTGIFEVWKWITTPGNGGTVEEVEEEPEPDYSNLPSASDTIDVSEPEPEPEVVEEISRETLLDFS